MLHSAVRALSKALIALTLAFYFPPAYSEVIDKVPQLTTICGVAIASGPACFACTYYRRWLLTLIAFPAPWFLSLFVEIHSADLGPALLVEAGYRYIVQAYLAASIVVALGMLGWIFNKR